MKIENIAEEECKRRCLNYYGNRQCLAVEWDKDKNNLCWLNYGSSKTSALMNPCDKTKFNIHYHELDCSARKPMCTCQQDPHCQSFDGKWLDFMGTCKYTMARDNCKDRLPVGNPTWEVIINNDRNIPTSTVSYVQEVTVKLYDKNLTIVLLTKHRLVVNGKQLHGYPQKLANGVRVIKTCSSVYVIVDQGPQIEWNGLARVIVSVPDDVKEKMCGICGDANGDPSDDWTIGDSDMCMDSFPGSPGQITTNGNEFGWSWFHSMDEKDKTCKDSCNNPPNIEECSESSMKKAEEHCNVLRDTNGKFSKCIALMPDDQANAFFRNCVYDSSLERVQHHCLRPCRIYE
jgi:hypothetical protein